MAMVASRPRRTREVTGPTPHSVALFARPTNKRPPEQLILDRRRQEEQRTQAEELTKYNKLCDLKNDWERSTDRRIQQNTVKRRVASVLQANRFSVEDRRERLRDMLREEELQYLQEMEAKEETTLERQAKMRERAKELKERREMERQAIVQEKLEQQWRNQCEELRSTLSKRQMDEVAAERMEQLRLKDEMAKAREDEERMYADLWYADMAAKAKREEEQTKKQMERNRDTLDILQRQMAALEAQKQEEKALKEEEAQLLKEQAELRKLEERRALEEKRIKQQETRELYDRSLLVKRQREAREMQEQMAFDMKLLEQLLEESRNEAREQSQRKRELREEDRRYREYLKALKEEKVVQERELERLINAEVEKTWQKRLAQWRLERQARRQLLQEVLDTRRGQLAEKLKRNEMRQVEAEQERVELLRKIEENKKIEKEQYEKLRSKNMQHQHDLIGQMDYNRRQLDAERGEEELQWQAGQEAELEYRRKLADALENPPQDKLHPARRARGQRSHLQDY